MKQSNGKKKHSVGAAILPAVLTLLNLCLTIALHFVRRAEILHAVRDDEQTKLLLTRAPEIKVEKSEKSCENA